MKHEKLLSGLCAGVLAFCLSFATVGSVVTAFGLPDSLWALALICLACAVFAVGAFTLRRSKWVLLAGAGVVCLTALSGQVRQQAASLVGWIWAFYEKGYGLAVPELFQTWTGSHLWPLGLICAAICVSVCWSVQRRTSTALAVFLALVPLAACFVLTDTVPALGFLLLWLLSLVLLTVPQRLRVRDTLRGCYLTGFLALPAAVFLGIMALAIPQAGYQPPIPAVNFEELVNWVAEKFPAANGGNGLFPGGSMNDTVDLCQLGQRQDLDTPVMVLETDYSGHIYLRGRSFDGYDGTRWFANAYWEEAFQPPGSQWTVHQGRLEITTLGTWNQKFLPYYSGDAQTLTGGAVPNLDEETRFGYACFALRPDWGLDWQDHYTEPIVDQRYLHLQSETQAWAEAQVSRIPNARSDLLYAADAIVQFVQNSASYTTDPALMPADQTDFARWFLTEADSGYCVHFATTATVLLRAAGIPARYVEGYLVEAEAGEQTLVRNKDAHAWVEIYVPQVGWVVMDPTPGMGEDSIFPPEETEPEQTEPTEPETTAPETRPPETTRPTQPETTQPTQPETSQPGPSESSQATGASGQGTTSDPPQAEFPRWLTGLIAGLCIGAALAIVTVAQWFVRRSLLLRHMSAGNPHRRAVARYRELARLLRRLGKPMPEQIQALAERSTFSQYALTPVELTLFDRAMAEAVTQLRQKNWLIKLFDRFILALY